MEATPKVHRQRHRRTDSRQRRHERQPNINNNNRIMATTEQTNVDMTSTSNIATIEEGCATLNSVTDSAAISHISAVTRLTQENERQCAAADNIEMVGSLSQTQSSQQTVVLVNGHAPPQEMQEMHSQKQSSTTGDVDAIELSNKDIGGADEQTATAGSKHSDSPTQTIGTGGGAAGVESGGNGNGGGNASSRNSSGDAMSLRETLQQLPPTISGHHHRHSRRTHSPQSPSSRTLEADSSFHRGILGFMDRELKQSSPTPSALSVGAASVSGGGSIGGASRKLQTLSDPQASPAQRSIRSRSSLEKSPRRKRSKSESRRRRERKLIAAGEMEVRQANETLMRYLKQCSEMNDASLSGELEIDANYDERRVHRKTKSQRDKRGQLIHKLYTAGGLSSLLKELSDDIVPADGEEIYNPFTPVVSPTDDTPAHIDKLFLQTSSGYRPVEHCYYKHSFVGAHRASIGMGRGDTAAGSGGSGANGSRRAGTGLRIRGSYDDTHCLLDSEFQRHEITSNIELSCVVQRFWILISNICHGLLAGLALAHLLFVLSCHPMEWSKVFNDDFTGGLAGETNNAVSIETVTTTTSLDNAIDSDSSGGQTSIAHDCEGTRVIISDYVAFAEIYLNTFYCLAIICLVSVLDRMDICRVNLSNATELISFRWLIIAMIYIATIILTICSDSIDEKLFLFKNAGNVTLTEQEVHSNSLQSVWSSLAVTRSIGAICGWIMIGLTPNEDLLYEHLVELTKYQSTNN